MTEMLQRLLAGHRLRQEEAETVMEAILGGTVPGEQIAALLTILRMRGETADELVGFVRALKRNAVPFPAVDGAVDTCGTGGDGAGTFNLSTAAALVVAGAGVKVAKHGNRAASSHCGSADVLEALGVPITLGPEAAHRCLESTGFCFLFAPAYHPTLARVRPIRTALGVPTVFNLLGPLLSPARVKRQVIGVSQAALLPLFTDILRREGATEAMVVAGRDGIDEISLGDVTDVEHLKGGSVVRSELTPEGLGLGRAPRTALAGGDAGENAAILERLFRGDERGPRRDAVIANAAAALVVAGRAERFPEAVALAAESLDGGRARAVVDKLRRLA